MKHFSFLSRSSRHINLQTGNGFLMLFAFLIGNHPRGYNFYNFFIDNYFIELFMPNHQRLVTVPVQGSLLLLSSAWWIIRHSNYLSITCPVLPFDFHTWPRLCCYFYFFEFFFNIFYVSRRLFPKKKCNHLRNKHWCNAEAKKANCWMLFIVFILRNLSSFLV